MSNAAHTPTPWAMQETPGGKAKIVDDKGFSIANTTAGAYNEQRANAAFIVRAVNSHEQLVAALRKIIEMNRQTAEDQYGDANKAESWSCIVVARAALAAAEA